MNQAWIAQLLSLWWSKPSPETLHCLRDPDKAEIVQSLWLEEGLSYKPLRALLNASNIAPFLLEREYERLFVGPGVVPCPPYESVWRKDRPVHEQGTIMGQCATEVSNLYARLGIQLSLQSNELPDHIAVEWEALAYARQNEATADLNKTLLDDHLAIWMPPFCSSVLGNSKLVFYQKLAAVTLECL